MTLLAGILSITLGAVAALHLLWAIGYWIPIRDEAALAHAVLGTVNGNHMPGAVPCALVAVALLFAAVLPHDSDFPARNPLLSLIALVFLLRGSAAYIPAWRRITPELPFARLDRLIYRPLCIALGIGYLTLVIGGF